MVVIRISSSASLGIFPAEEGDLLVIFLASSPSLPPSLLLINILLYLLLPSSPPPSFFSFSRWFFFSLLRCFIVLPYPGIHLNPLTETLARLSQDPRTNIPDALPPRLPVRSLRRPLPLVTAEQEMYNLVIIALGCTLLVCGGRMLRSWTWLNRLREPLGDGPLFGMGRPLCGTGPIPLKPLPSMHLA